MIITEHIRDINLLSVVEAAGVEMRKSGSRYLGRCPLHDEKTASFFVFNNNRFKCFGCQEYGDAINFIQKLHGIGFMQACSYLGLKNSKPTPEIMETIRKQKEQRLTKLRFNRWRGTMIDEYATLYRNSSRLLSTINTEDDLERFGSLFYSKEQWRQLYKFFLETDKKTLFNMFMSNQ